LSLAFLPCSAWAETAKDIVANADRIRYPDKSFRIVATVTDYHSGQAADRDVFIVYSKTDPATGQFRNVVRYAEPPRDAGKMLLMRGPDLWFYDPAARQSIRISPQQKLTGEASAADVLSENLVIDYEPRLVGTEAIEDAARATRKCFHLELKAANDAAAYLRVEYWVEQNSYQPIKVKFYADSGSLLKTLYYRGFEARADGTIPTQAVIIDAVDPTLVTTVDFGEPSSRDIPESWFARDYLPHLKLD
jgi:hypothetical protein